MRIDRNQIREEIRATVELMRSAPDQLPERLVREFHEMRVVIEEEVRAAKATGRRFYQEKRITPGGALYLLSINTENREIKTTKIIQWINEILAGRWEINGVGIIVADTNELNDGQHRLIALWIVREMLWESDEGALDILVSLGVSRESRFSLDNGAVRSAADGLALRNVPNSGTASSIARNIIAFDKSGKTTIGRKGEISGGEIQNLVINDYDLRDATEWAQKAKTKLDGIVGASITGMAFYLLSKIDKLDALHYLDGIRDGADGGDIRMRVRETMRKMTGTSSVSPQKLEVILRGWNAYRRSADTQSFRARNEMPYIAGFPYGPDEGPPPPRGMQSKPGGGMDGTDDGPVRKG